MNKLLTLAVSLPLAACVVGSDVAPGGDGTNPGGPTGDPGSSTTEHIAADAMWSGTMSVAKSMIVDAGVKLTIAPGTTVSFAGTGSLVVKGILDVQGTKASPVHLSPATAGDHYAGISVQGTGELKMAYAVQVGGGISVDSGKITVTDTLMSQASGDFLVANGGTINVSYSAIGLEPGAGTDSTHCDMHFGGDPGTITITHSNISSSSYGLMLYAGVNTNLTYNNWFNNTTQVEPSGTVSGDVSNGWFDKGAPVSSGNATFITANLSTTRLPAASVDPVKGTGPR